jgi:glycosyltransferase involved in cell wall biosynthesis
VNSHQVLIIEENSTIPFDRRVWYEATALRDEGWQVTVICPGETIKRENRLVIGNLEESSEDLDGIKVCRFPLEFAVNGVGSYFREYIIAFINIIKLSWRVWKTEGFDALHVCNPPDIFFPMSILYRFLGVRVVFDHHDLFPEMVLGRFEGMKGKFFYGFARLLEYLSFKSANVVISNNQSFFQLAHERGKVSKNKIVMVRNGPRTEEFKPLVPTPELKGNFPFMVCFAGVMGEEDGILELIESIKYIIKHVGRKDILFSLLGDGSSRSRALLKVSDWGLDDYVNMPGMIHDDILLRKYLSTADICVSPEPLTPMNLHSTFIKIGEYMAMGKPVVAYDLEESRYTAQESAIYVTPGDTKAFGQAIIDLIDNPQLCERMGRYGLRRVQNLLSWEHQQKQLIQAYKIALS